MNAQNVYRIDGKEYTQNECEAVYLFWKAKLEEVGIREDINAVLESVTEKADEEDKDFEKWTKAHMEDCVGAVARNRQQDALFQRLLSDGGDGPDSLAVVEGCLRDLFAHSGRKAS